MTHLIAWAKQNSLTVVAIVLVPLCIAALAYVHIVGRSFQDEMASQVDWGGNVKGTEKAITTARQLGETSVEVFSDNPEESLSRISICINDAAIVRKRQIRQSMDQEYRNLFQWAVDRNRHGLHYPYRLLVAELFPGPPSDAAMPFVARDAYRRVLLHFTAPFDPEAEYPSLNAGRALTVDFVQQELERFEQEHEQANVGATADLSADELGELRDKKYQYLMTLLYNQARKFHLYANTPLPTNATQPQEIVLAPDTPFYMGPWVDSSQKPTMRELWKAQMDLWIQQNVVEAVALTNRVDDPTINVLSAAVKRLISIDIDPGYVGVSSRGGLDLSAAEGGLAPRRQAGGFGFGLQGGAEVVDPGKIMAGGGSDDEDLGDEFADQAGTRPDGQMPEHFEWSPTGRRSNPLYDVRHATVRLIIDSQRIPEFLNNLSRVNFVTVLLVQMHDVDEYEHLRGAADRGPTVGNRSGQALYLYGPDDVVELEVVVESIFLRRWTAGHWDEAESERLGEPFDPGLMPNDVRTILGLQVRKTQQPDQGSQDEDLDAS